MNSSPKLGSEIFQCPHCDALSHHKWFDTSISSDAVNEILLQGFYEYRKNIRDYQQTAIEAFLEKANPIIVERLYEYIPQGLSVATCVSCKKYSLWVGQDIVYPKRTIVPLPNEDLNQEIQDLYLEASAIVGDSPKGATALLRLALQLLLKQLGMPGKNINEDIKLLVSGGLSPIIQKALDLLRVVGNNAVHPGQVDFEDNREIALKMFHVLNFIANETITKPKELDLLYADVVPESTQQHIVERDGN